MAKVTMPENSPIKFGTDGWRGIIAQDFTFENVCICAQAVTNYLKEVGLAERGLLIGYDTRFASADFAGACAEVAAANGIKVYLCSKATPTPVISYGVMTKKAGGAIVITASHNAAKWNGLKFKTEQGASAPTQTVVRLDKNIAAISGSKDIKRMPLTQAIEQRLVEETDLIPEYTEQVERLIDLKALRQAKLKVAVDSMYGAGAGYFKMLLKGSNIELVEINSQPNPTFPGMLQPEPIAVNLTRLTALVREEGADIGLATDCDADRIGIIDEKGNFITQLQVFALLALYLLEVRGERGPIVKTLTTGSMLNCLGKLYDIPIYETAVGFMNVAPVMIDKDALIGGEESGGYGFRGHVPERDAFPAGLFFLDLMVKTGKTPSELLDYLYSKIRHHYYRRLDIKCRAGEWEKIMISLQEAYPEFIDGSRMVSKDTTDGFRFTLDDSSWLLIRPSGTEPLLRIYSESSSNTRVDRLLKLGKKMAGV
jgi:alpha-D-glucose phosphate-specific phosphoglucomutase